MTAPKKIRASVIGASGYTGAELLRILITHPSVDIIELVAERSAGQPIDAVYSHLRGFNLPDIVSLKEANFDNIDVAFCCLPHATTQQVVKTLPKHLKVVDLSADFRLYDPNTYKEWYGHEHFAPELQEEAAYGLTEHYREQIKSSRIIACPGCYPTSVLLPLIPLLKAELISSESIIIDSASGMTGAGRSVKQDNLFTEINEGMKAYAVCQHRHMPEIEQALSECSGNEVLVHFTPRVAPMSRGILSVMYVTLANGASVNSLHQTLTDSYKDEAFIKVLTQGIYPKTRDVRDTNLCHIAVVPGRTEKTAVIISVIDNLTKGSSGQAVQNMNLLFDLPETEGLKFVPAFP